MSEVGKQVAGAASGDERPQTAPENGDAEQKQAAPPQPDQGKPDDNAPQNGGETEEQLRARVAALEEQHRKATEEAEAARKAAEEAKLSEEERAKQQIEEALSAVGQERDQLRADRLALELDRRGVAAKYRQFVSDVDPGTDEGRQALDKFVADYPEAIERAAEPRPPADDEIKIGGDKLARSNGLTDRANLLRNLRDMGVSEDKIRAMGGR